MKIVGLVSGTTYSFQVRAIGGSTGYSDWSNTRIASLFCYNRDYSKLICIGFR
jgi:hypothetical protein